MPECERRWEPFLDDERESCAEVESVNKEYSVLGCFIYKENI